jgi:hypothetical protein
MEIQRMVGDMDHSYEYAGGLYARRSSCRSAASYLPQISSERRRDVFKCGNSSELAVAGWTAPIVRCVTVIWESPVPYCMVGRNYTWTNEYPVPPPTEKKHRFLGCVRSSICSVLGDTVSQRNNRLYHVAVVHQREVRKTRGSARTVKWMLSIEYITS